MKSDGSVHDEAGVLAGIVPSVNLAAEAGRMDFYQRARSRHLAPLWRVLHGLVTDRPAPRCVPAMWRYTEIRPYLMEACKLISAEEAERRVHDDESCANCALRNAQDRPPA